jgi:hypothetical protein
MATAGQLQRLWTTEEFFATAQHEFGGIPLAEIYAFTVPQLEPDERVAELP